MPSDAPPSLDAAVAVLRGGGLVALPTETVYGLGADARNEAAVRRVFAVKGRPVDHPLIVHVANAGAIDDWAMDVPDDARRLAARFWPGPLTLVLWRATSVLDVVTGGLDTVALRMPDHPVALALLTAFGGGIAAPSANRFGRVSPTEAAHVARDLGDAVDLILDGGPCAVGVESTIVDLTSEIPVVLRPGLIGVEALEEALGRPVSRTPTGPSRAPGMLRAHYAPRARVEIVEARRIDARAASVANDSTRVGVLGMGLGHVDERAGYRVYDLGTSGHDAARRLYAALRAADDDAIDVLLVVMPEGASGALDAVVDRLRRAAAASSASLEP